MGVSGAPQACDGGECGALPQTLLVFYGVPESNAKGLPAYVSSAAFARRVLADV
jgi:hypothetical protein